MGNCINYNTYCRNGIERYTVVQSLFLYQSVSEDCICQFPSVLTSNGISRIVDLPLIDSEQVALHGGSTLA